MAINRFDIYLVRLDPTVGSEIEKTRPCLVVSPDELYHHCTFRDFLFKSFERR